jgi:DNA-binding MarR family transcriptional regulator
MKRTQNHLEHVPEFRNNVVALARRLRHAVRADSENWTALMVLGAIQRAKGTGTPTRIATELGLQSSNLAQVLGELDRRGLIQRIPDHADRRKVRLSLTQAGLDLVRESRGRRDQWLSDAMKACLSAEEQAQLLAAGTLIQRVARWSESSLDSSD